eukprot:scaffold398_cov177-Ochromonas_danica.AAC.17
MKSNRVKPKKNLSWLNIGGCIILVIILVWASGMLYFLSVRKQNVSPIGSTQQSTPNAVITLSTPTRTTTSTTETATTDHENPHLRIKASSQASPSHPSLPWQDDLIHIVFSTDCSYFQDWQSLLVFHTAQLVHQPGHITRIASGCPGDKQAELKALYAKLYPHAHVHFTPDFKMDNQTKKKYDFYNKPYGLLHWLQHAEPSIPSDTIVVLIDPDMILLRPISLQIAHYPTLLVLDHYNNRHLDVPSHVKHGQPAAQIYGLGAPWATNSKHFNRTEVCGEDSPCLQVSREDGEDFYSVGPPYLVEKDDLLRLTESWTSFVPKVYARYPALLAEMYAYSMAAAHEELPHFIMRHYMISNTDMNEEGWKYIDDLGENVCEPPDQSSGLFYPNRLLPNILHYCQFYRVGEFGFQKRRFRKKMLSCDGPLLAALPNDLGKLRYKNRDGENMPLRPVPARRNAFMLCAIHRSINSMLRHYREKMCGHERDMIYQETENLLVSLKVYKRNASNFPQELVRLQSHGTVDNLTSDCVSVGSQQVEKWECMLELWQGVGR